MSRICEKCLSICDLCPNGYYWAKSDSSVGLIRDPEITNGIQMSGKLDDAFKQNFEKYPNIYWQNFGAQEGYLRVYPAARWKTVDELPDLFDVRRRPWYIHGSVSPKDMIILLDTSGSMHGQSFDIMKLAAKTMINTLGENDFVNVASFSKNVSWVTPCLDTLVQANSRNKRLLFDGIDKLEDRFIASYADALEFAYTNFETFTETKDPRNGADCHKLIMIFSDGGTVYPEEIIEKYMNQTVTKHVRIFSYAVGPHPLPTVALKSMACATGGSFTTITSMGAIRTKIQTSYLSVIAQPEVLSGTHILGYSSVYLDALITNHQRSFLPKTLALAYNGLNTINNNNNNDYIRVLSKPMVLSNPTNFYHPTHFSTDHLGLGLLTTVTLPVFKTGNNSKLIGVVGIDIPVDNFIVLSPQERLGPLGYTFALNPNGFLVFHPDMWMDQNYLEDPAHIDFEDIEGETDEIKDIRKFMIEKDSGQVKINKEGVDTIYYFKKIQNSSFTLGVVAPQIWTYLKVGYQDLKIITDIDENDLDSTISVAPWVYCGEGGELKEKQNLSSLIQDIADRSCKNNDRINHLAFDIKNSRPIFDSLLSRRDSSSMEDGKVPNKFLMTDGGLILRAFHSSDDQERSSFMDDLEDPYNSTLYETVLRHSVRHNEEPMLYLRKTPRSRILLPKYKFSSGSDETIFDNDEIIEIVTKPDLNNNTQDNESQSESSSSSSASLYLVKAFTITKNNKAFTGGIAGVEVTRNYLRNLFNTATSKTEKLDEYNCINSEEINCLLVDSSGYILYSNDNDTQIGEFLGKVDSQLMRHLNNELKGTQLFT